MPCSTSFTETVKNSVLKSPTPCPIVCLLSQSHFKPKLVTLLLTEDSNDETSSVNYIDEEQRTYLWFCKTVEACKFLINRGININHVRVYGHFNEYRETVLDHLSKKSFEMPEVVAYLISCQGKYSRELV